MGPLVHCFIAKKVLGSDYPLVLLGAVLPDLGWMDKKLNCPELHEGGLKLKAYLGTKNPKFLPFALGMLTHGVEYGLDRYSDVDWQGKGKGWAHLLASPLYREVTQACLIDEKTGRQLAHNFIELAVEYWLDKENPDLKNELSRALQSEEIARGTAKYISDCFEVSQKKLENSLQMFSKLCAPENLSGIEGIVNFWNKACQMFLSHGINKPKAKIALKHATEVVKDEWEEFLDFAIFEIRKKKVFCRT